MKLSDKVQYSLVAAERIKALMAHHKQSTENIYQDLCDEADVSEHYSLGEWLAARKAHCEHLRVLEHEMDKLSQYIVAIWVTHSTEEIPSEMRPQIQVDEHISFSQVTMTRNAVSD